MNREELGEYLAPPGLAAAIMGLVMVMMVFLKWYMGWS